jgi:uncharacterized repeat protein (TIGR03803 family)
MSSCGSLPALSQMDVPDRSVTPTARPWQVDSAAVTKSLGSVTVQVMDYLGEDRQLNCGLPYAGLIADASGNFYGTTYGGGAYGDGAIFKLTPSGSLRSSLRGRRELRTALAGALPLCPTRMAA